MSRPVQDPVECERQRRTDKLIDALHNGEITPEEAENFARLEGLAPLRPSAAPDEYLPEKEVYWTLPMVIAWIVWRTLDRVRQQYDPYRSASPFWFYRTYESMGARIRSEEPQGGYFLTEQSKASAMDLSLQEAFGLITEREYYSAVTTVRLAREDVWRKAGIGRITAYAVRCSDGEVVPIPDYEWSYLVLHQNHGRDELCFEHNQTPRFHSIRFRQSEIKKCWSKSGASSRAKSDARKRCKEWFEALVQASPELPSMTKPKVEAYAAKSFGVARDVFRPIRAEVIEKHGAVAWSKGGRPKANRADKIGRRK